MPKEIAEFYQTHNFISAFSTPLERNALFKMPAGATLSSRLEKVKTAAEQIARQRLQSGSRNRTDKIVFSGTGTGVFFRIETFNRSDDNGIARVDAFSISHGTNLALIALYEKQPGMSETDFESQCLDLVQKEKTQKEIHFWFNIDNRWLIHRSRIGQME